MDETTAGDSVHIDPQLLAAAAKAMYERIFPGELWEDAADDRPWGGYRASYMAQAKVALEAVGVPALLTQLAEQRREIESLRKGTWPGGYVIEMRDERDAARVELESLRTALLTLSATQDHDALGTTSGWWRERVARIALSGVPEPPEDNAP